MLTRLRRSGRAQGSSGMTVIEVSIAIALLMVIMAPALFFVATTQRNQANVANATSQQANARVALQAMTRYLRQAEYPAGMTYASTGSDMFATTTSDDIAFFSEVNAVVGTGGTGTVYKVEYKVSGTNLVQYLTPPTLSGGTYSYNSANTTSKTVISDVKNDNPAGCTNFSGTTTLFSYYKQDASTGQLVQVTSPSTYQSTINYVVINLVTGDATNQAPGCNEVQTAVALRNWRA